MVSKATSIRRLTKLTEIIRNVPKDKWNMYMWMATVNSTTGRRYKNREIVCGTVGCALGHACTDRGFRRFGLKLAVSPISGHAYPTYRCSSQELAGATFFGISLDQATRIFMPWECYSNPRTSKGAVIKRIEKVIKEVKAS